VGVELSPRADSPPVYQMDWGIDKIRAAMRIATNVCLVSLTTRYFWGTPT
jgi:hypothetical protein